MSDARPTRRADASQESRRLLIDAATDLFADRGFRGTTFEDIAARSRISRGSIPWHFGNKEGLLTAVVEQAVTQLEAASRASGSGGTDAAQALAEFTRSRSARLFLTLLGEAAEPGSPLRSWYAEFYRSQRAQARSSLPGLWSVESTDADELSTILVGAVIGIHQQWRIDPDGVDLEATYRVLAQLLRGGRSAPEDGFDGA